MNATKMDWATGTEIHYSMTVGIYWLQVSGRNDGLRWFSYMNWLAAHSQVYFLLFKAAARWYDLRLHHSWGKPQKCSFPPPPILWPPTAKLKDWGGWNAGRYSGKQQDSREHSRSFSHFCAQEPADEQQQVHNEYFCIWAWLCKRKYADKTVKVLKGNQLFIKNAS